MLRSLNASWTPPSAPPPSDLGLPFQAPLPHLPSRSLALPDGSAACPEQALLTCVFFPGTLSSPRCLSPLFIQGSAHPSVHSTLLHDETTWCQEEAGQTKTYETGPTPLKSSGSWISVVRATLGWVQRLLFQEVFTDCCSHHKPALSRSPIDPRICSSLLVPCFLPGVIHLMPVSLGLHPKGTYHTVLHYVPINRNTRLR